MCEKPFIYLNIYYFIYKRPDGTERGTVTFGDETPPPPRIDPFLPCVIWALSEPSSGKKCDQDDGNLLSVVSFLGTGTEQCH